MARVNITEAARLAGIGRQHLYRKYLRPKDKKGKLLAPLITVEEDHAGNSVIDTAEILRVFGKLHGDIDDITSRYDSTREETRQQAGISTVLATETTRLQVQLTAANRELTELRGTVHELQDDKAWLKAKVDDLTAALKHIEYRSTEPAPPLTVATGPGTVQATGVPAPEEETTAQPVRRGLFSWIFGR